MAKQSFVTGQVLTAQQVNDLQTNDFNQTVSAKTASYTLVAADKGTRITMSSTSATTITVNNSLFAAGDTLFIQNLNTGVCTITAGTATVSTSASLALAQHEGGTLYFTSAGVSTFFKAAGAAASSGGMTLISTTAMTGASITLSSIPQTYKNLNLIIRNPLPASDNVILSMRFNGDSGLNYAYADNVNTTDQASPHSGCILHVGQDNSVAQGMLDVRISDYTNSVSIKTINSLSIVNNHTNTSNWNITGYNCVWDNTAAITSITLHYQSGNMTSGSVLLYGVA